jgi:hypothetical protein
VQGCECPVTQGCDGNSLQACAMQRHVQAMPESQLEPACVCITNSQAWLRSANGVGVAVIGQGATSLCAWLLLRTEVSIILTRPHCRYTYVVR